MITKWISFLICHKINLKQENSIIQLKLSPFFNTIFECISDLYKIKNKKKDNAFIYFNNKKKNVCTKLNGNMWNNKKVVILLGMKWFE